MRFFNHTNTHNSVSIAVYKHLVAVKPLIQLTFSPRHEAFLAPTHTTQMFFLYEPRWCSHPGWHKRHLCPPLWNTKYNSIVRKLDPSLGACCAVESVQNLHRGCASRKDQWEGKQLLEVKLNLGFPLRCKEFLACRHLAQETLVIFSTLLYSPDF